MIQEARSRLQDNSNRGVNNLEERNVGEKKGTWEKIKEREGKDPNRMRLSITRP